MAAFTTTRWSVVAAAQDDDSPAAAAALEKLCRAYWYPLDCNVRRRGLAAADAQDLTQEFFFRLIGKDYLKSVDRDLGSFRSFLTASINHLLAKERDKARALKRGGGHEILSLDLDDAESRFVREPSVVESPERSFDRRWAMTVLDGPLRGCANNSKRPGTVSSLIC